MSDWHTCRYCGEYVDSSPDFHTVACLIRQQADREQDRRLELRAARAALVMGRRRG